jgi:hypothetical protein
MKGAIINHPLFGRGQVLELRNAGRDLVVRFDNGIRATVPAGMLKVIQSVEAETPAPKPFLIPRPERVFTPEETMRLEARRTVEALRYGLVPSKRIRELSVGLEDEKASLQRALDNSAKHGGDVRVVVGEYGAGKSHFFELAAQEALAHNFLVGTTSLDLREVPPNRPQRIYLSLMRSLRYPDNGEVGLVPLLEKILTQPNYAEIQDEIKETFFASALHNYSLLRDKPGEMLDLLIDWMSGEKVFIADVRKNTLKDKAFPVKGLSQLTTAADQYCYLLNGWGWLATQAGYAGLAVFIDESEHYSLLTQRGKEKADNFFKALIYTALGERGKISEDDLTHQHHSHPFRLKDNSHLLLLFALTPTGNTFDYNRWLNEDQILELKKYLPPEALDELMARLYVLHRQSYSYENHGQFLDLARGLLECLDNGLINLRQVIRLSIEIFDLCYAHRDYSATQAITELRRALL